MSVYVTHTQNGFDCFRKVVTYTTFGLLAVITFLKSRKMSTADWIRDKIMTIVKGDLLSRLHT